MNNPRRRRGDPLIALAVIVSSWIGVRALAWDRVGSALLTRADVLAPRAPDATLALAEARFTPWPENMAPPAAVRPVGGADDGDEDAGVGGDWRRPAFAHGGAPTWGVSRSRAAGSYLSWTLPRGEPAASGAQLASTRSPGGNAAPFPVPSAVPPGKAKRWSMDAWLLARKGTGPTLAGGPAPASYGASQAGAIVRYAFAPSSRYRPSAYARVDSALGGAGESEVALGLSARPLPSVPVIALGEVRATRSDGKLRFRPAAMLVSQLPPFALPLGLRGEAYAQGGYVAGRGATPFFDGQFTFDRPFARVLGHQVRLGGGVWGGAQKDAARLDIGPSTRVDVKLNSRIFGRLALDYRLHVAGNAQPGSGPALTASAGF